jgi:hypothetical protein
MVRAFLGAIEKEAASACLSPVSNSFHMENQWHQAQAAMIFVAMRSQCRQALAVKAV